MVVSLTLLLLVLFSLFSNFYSNHDHHHCHHLVTWGKYLGWKSSFSFVSCSHIHLSDLSTHSGKEPSRDFPYILSLQLLIISKTKCSVKFAISGSSSATVIKLITWVSYPYLQNPFANGSYQLCAWYLCIQAYVHIAYPHTTQENWKSSKWPLLLRDITKKLVVTLTECKSISDVGFYFLVTLGCWLQQ